MPSVDCTNCKEEHRVIEPMKANHVGSIQCDACGENFYWKSPAGTRNLFVKDEDTDENED